MFHSIIISFILVILYISLAYILAFSFRSDLHVYYIETQPQNSNIRIFRKPVICYITQPLIQIYLK